MPLFTRPDGTLVRGLPAMRRIMPFVMRGRNESAVYVALRCDVTSTKKWIWAYNRASPGEPCTLLLLFLFALRRMLERHPELDRFISGDRIYQRKTSTASLVVKESLEQGAPSYTVKLPLAEPGESLGGYSRRIAEILRNAKAHEEKLERDVARALLLPACLVRLLVALRNWLDRWNLLPGSLLSDDPLCTSVFVANLGSLGLHHGFHHLYEFGTCSAFAVLWSIESQQEPAGDDIPERRDIFPIHWTIDDRVVDGFTGAAAFRLLKSLLENPVELAGPPEEAARSPAP